MPESLPVNVREFTCKCQRVFLYALDQNLTTWKSKADACAYHVNLFFVDPPCFANSSPPPRKSDIRTDRMTEIEILEDIYVAQVASLFAGVVKNSVLPRWRSAAITSSRILRGDN